MNIKLNAYCDLVWRLVARSAKCTKLAGLSLKVVCDAAIDFCFRFRVHGLLRLECFGDALEQPNIIMLCGFPSRFHYAQESVTMTASRSCIARFDLPQSNLTRLRGDFPISKAFREL